MNWLLIIIIIILLIITILIFSISYRELYCSIFLSRKDDEKRWTNNENIKLYNNCYAYAFTDLDHNRKSKPYPGEKVGLNHITKNEENYTCRELVRRILLDYPEARYLGNDPNLNNYNCSCGHHLVFVSIDSEKKDFHVYRKNSDNLWSHKPGSLEVFFVDWSNKKITNPWFSDKRVYEFNYNKPCGYFCVKTNVLD